MLITELALVAETPNVTCSQLNRVAAALQKQAIRDFAPIWDVVATIDGFERLEDVPIGYWPIIVRDDIDVPGAAGVRYTFGGHLTGPRRIARGGYLSWHEAVSDHWWQQIWFDGDEPRFRDLGRLTERVGSLRSAIDARTQTALRMAREGARSASLTAARQVTAQIKTSTGSRAEGLRQQIEDIRGAGAAEGVWVDEPGNPR